MIISEKQILQLITLVSEYSERLRHMPYEEPKSYSVWIDKFLGEISKQQSEELKVIE
jgi:hypothetical protein